MSRNIARPADGPVCRSCWRHHPAATRACDGCGVVTRLYHFGLCTACACPGVVRRLLTASDGGMHEAARAVAGILAADENPAAVLKWLESATARTLLTSLAELNGPLDHALIDQLRPARAAVRLRALLVAHGALPVRDEYLALLERWITTTVRAIPDVADRRLVLRFATWHHLRRLRHLCSRGRRVGYGQISGARGELSTIVALLAWLRSRGTTIGQAQQTDIDEWLAAGAASRRGASAFVSWAVRRGHATSIDIPPHSNPKHRRVLPHHDQRWRLVRRLLHDENVHTVDRVAGLLILLYAQPVSRIATLTLDRIHTDAGGTHLHLGTSPVRLPPPLDRLVGDLVQRRAGWGSIGRSVGNPWLFPGVTPGQPLSAPRLGARLKRLGITARLCRNTAMMDLAVQLPAAVLSQMLGLHRNTATDWTIEAGNTRLRYAAAIASTRSPAGIPGGSDFTSDRTVVEE